MITLLLIVIYFAFISLGLPDGLLGAAWPSMYQGLHVPLSYAGILSMIIAGGTIISALFSERLIHHLGTGLVTAISVAMTAAALLGFTISPQFWMLCLWAIPYGLGAGSVDAALNNFVALHYKSRHMSWLHCFWGVGCTAGPYLLSYYLTGGQTWESGYRAVFILQIILTAILIFSLPIWKKITSSNVETQNASSSKPLGLRNTLALNGVKEVMITFFCYCTVEQTASLWAVSYITLEKGFSPSKAASFGALFFIGITIGRFANGFLTAKFNDKQLIFTGQIICALGIFTFLLPLGTFVTILGLLLIGLGCAPIYPCLIHATPTTFGANVSQAVIGVQMASAYIGTCLMPPVFGFLAQHISIALFPYFLGVFLVLMIVFSRKIK